MASASSPTAASGRRLPWWWRPATAICRPFPPRAAGWRRRSGRWCPRTTGVPNNLPAGGVLVVGASSTGVQLADEIQRSGRQVTLAVGRHTRLPRRYRGRDILWWLDQLGVLSQGADAVHDIERSRHQPSLQLVGRPDHSSLDLAVLHDRGVRLVGRVRDIDGHRVSLADDLRGDNRRSRHQDGRDPHADRSVHRHNRRRRHAARAVQPDLAPRCRRSRPTSI